MLLKPNMVLAGYDCPEQPTAGQVAEATLRCLRLEVPAEVPGIVFLSGGQSDAAATEHLNAINLAPGPKPWQLSFSYGRALQSAAQSVWRGARENIPAAQAAYLHRVRMNGAARSGTWSPDLEAE
jgi:fructose-bisphosphate aldolase class I